MKQIILKSLRLQNFQGASSVFVEFSEKETNISGKNRSGKTTLFDAFIWLLFGKDSGGLKEFDIKTLDQNNEPMHNLDHLVEGEIYHDGTLIVLKRIYKEKWVKKRGNAESEMTGHETLYFANDVPLSQKEYQEKVQMICDETIFKSITNPHYFNELKWTEQREMLFKIAGQISDKEICEQNEEFGSLIELLSGKSLTEFKKELSAKKKKLNDILNEIQPRLAEVNNSITSADQYDYDQLRKEIEEGKQEIENINLLINSEVSRFEATNKKQVENQKKIIALNAEISKIENIHLDTASKKNNEIKAEKEKVEKEKAELNKKIEEHNNKVSDIHKSILNLTQDKQSLVERYNLLMAETFQFDEEKCVCPTCKRKLDQSDIESQKETLLKNFNNNRVKQVDEINQKGTKINSDIEKLESELKELEKTNLGEKFNELEAKIFDAEINVDEEFEKLCSNDDVYKNLLLQVEALENESFENTVDTSELEAKRSWLQNEINENSKKLATEKFISDAKERIAQLESDKLNYAQQIADLEKIEFKIEKFNKFKIESIEQKINSMFNFVSFKLFEKQINGQEVECCTALVNGVPYYKVNTESKLNAGLDIINCLSKFFEVSAPIFIDNRESVHKIIPTNAQIINLIANEKFEKLFVEFV